MRARLPLLSIAVATVVVPPLDRSPPEALLSIDDRGGLRAVAVGRDADGGVARVRVSVEERTKCRDLITGRRSQRTRVRYFPPPAIERTKVTPGTRLPVKRRHVVPLPIPGDPCPGSELDRLEGVAWADVTNAHEREATSTPRRYSRRPLLQTLLDALLWISL